MNAWVASGVEETLAVTGYFYFGLRQDLAMQLWLASISWQPCLSIARITGMYRCAWQGVLYGCAHYGLLYVVLSGLLQLQVWHSVGVAMALPGTCL